MIPKILLAVVGIILLSFVKAEYDVAKYCQLVPIGTKFPSLESFQTFYTCQIYNRVDTSNCPGTDVFNKDVQLCVPKANDNYYDDVSNPCENKHETWVVDVENCHKWHYCSNGAIRGSGTCPNGQYFENDKKQCVHGKCSNNNNDQGELKNLCQIMQTGQYFGDFKDCAIWHKCDNLEMKCDACKNGLLYNTQERMCLHDDGKMCERTGGIRPPVKPTIPEGNCHTGKKQGDINICSIYYECKGSEWNMVACKTNQYFDIVKGECRSRQIASPVKTCDRCEFSSVAWVNAVDEKCTLYYTCQNGQAVASGTCKENYFFNEDHQQCIRGTTNLDTYRESHGACLVDSCNTIECKVKKCLEEGNKSKYECELEVCVDEGETLEDCQTKVCSDPNSSYPECESPACDTAECKLKECLDKGTKSKYECELEACVDEGETLEDCKTKVCSDPNSSYPECESPACDTAECKLKECLDKGTKSKYECELEVCVGGGNTLEDCQTKVCSDPNSSYPECERPACDTAECKLKECLDKGTKSKYECELEVCVGGGNTLEDCQTKVCSDPNSSYPECESPACDTTDCKLKKCLEEGKKSKYECELEVCVDEGETLEDCKTKACSDPNSSYPECETPACDTAECKLKKCLEEDKKSKYECELEACVDEGETSEDCKIKVCSDPNSSYPECESPACDTTDCKLKKCLEEGKKSKYECELEVCVDEGETSEDCQTKVCSDPNSSYPECESPACDTAECKLKECLDKGTKSKYECELEVCVGGGNTLEDCQTKVCSDPNSSYPECETTACDTSECKCLEEGKLTEYECKLAACLETGKSCDNCKSEICLNSTFNADCENFFCDSGNALFKNE